MKFLSILIAPVVFVACLFIASTVLTKGSGHYSPLDTYIKTEIQKSKDSANFSRSVQSYLKDINAVK